MERFVKICGITNPEDAAWAAECGATAIGLIFARESPRKIALETAKRIVSLLPDSVQRIGVFVNEPVELVNRYVRALGLAYAQLHGEEQPDYCRTVEGNVIKAVRVADHRDIDRLKEYRVSAFLLDAFSPQKRGGTGRTFNWSLAIEAKEYGLPVILSGGLNPENVVEAIEIVAPAGVDASSGVETSPGKKDREKVRSFVERAMGAFEKFAARPGCRQKGRGF
jgi:phosphoribosylanthranilate isomerase